MWWYIGSDIIIRGGGVMKIVLFFLLSFVILAEESIKYKPSIEKSPKNMIGKYSYLEDFNVESIEYKYGRYILVGKSSDNVEMDHYIDSDEEIILVLNPLIVDKLEDYLSGTKNRKADVHFFVEPFQKNYYFGEVEKVEFYNSDRSRKRTFEDGRGFLYGNIEEGDFVDKGATNNLDYYLGRTISLEKLWVSPKIVIEDEVILLSVENEEKTIQSTDYRKSGLVILLRQEVYNQFKMYIKEDKKIMASFNIKISKENGCYIGKVESVNLCGDDKSIKKSYE